jgi:hypothetical protein
MWSLGRAVGGGRLLEYVGVQTIAVMLEVKALIAGRTAHVEIEQRFHEGLYPQI